MSSSNLPAITNRLLQTLPSRSRSGFLASCERVDLKFAQVLHEPGDRTRHLYFPLDGFISLITTLDDGVRLEVGMVGDEGLVGTSLILGINTSSERALVQGAGAALRISTTAFERHCRHDVAIRSGLCRYVHVFMRQLAVSTACAHYHMVEARLARWLLLTRDRAHADQFQLTHEFLSYMLGVRRVGITQAATALHERGLINYSRGKIDIRDSDGLERAACCCYRQAENIYKETLGPKRKTRVRKLQS